MTVLTRYLLRSHIAPMVFAFVALTGVVLINTLAKSMADLAGKGLPRRLFFEFFLLSLPANIALTLPMSVLVAVLYTFSQMAAENEVTALKASGVDLRRIVLPLLVVASMIAGGMVWFNNEVLPAANYRWRMLMMDVAQTSPLLTLREQVINPIPAPNGGSRAYLRAARIVEGKRLYDVAIFDISTLEESRTIYADSGNVAWTPDGRDMVLTLFDGAIREVDLTAPESFQQAMFGRQVMRLTGAQRGMERTQETSFRTDRDMTGAMMRAQIDTLRTELVEARKVEGDPAPPSTGLDAPVEPQGPTVLYSQARVQQLRSQIRGYQVEIQKKYAIATATVVFVLIGVPLALRFPRGGVGMVIAVSLSIFSVYYVGLIGGESLADEGLVPPWVAMWLTNGVFGLLGLFGLFLMGREQSTGRGEGWGELPRWLRLPRTRRRSGRAVEA